MTIWSLTEKKNHYKREKPIAAFEEMSFEMSLQLMLVKNVKPWMSLARICIENHVKHCWPNPLWNYSMERFVLKDPHIFCFYLLLYCWKIFGLLTFQNLFYYTFTHRICVWHQIMKPLSHTLLWVNQWSLTFTHKTWVTAKL